MYTIKHGIADSPFKWVFYELARTAISIYVLLIMLVFFTTLGVETDKETRQAELLSIGILIVLLLAANWVLKKSQPNFINVYGSGEVRGYKWQGYESYAIVSVIISAIAAFIIIDTVSHSADVISANAAKNVGYAIIVAIILVAIRIFYRYKNGVSAVVTTELVEGEVIEHELPQPSQQKVTLFISSMIKLLILLFTAIVLTMM